MTSSPEPRSNGSRTAITLLVAALASVLVVVLVRQDQPKPSTPPQAAAAETQPTPTPAKVAPARAQELLAEAVALDHRGETRRANTLAEAAKNAGAGRDASLLLAKIAILERRYRDALAELTPLAQADAADPEAQYNLGLVHHSTTPRNYNAARSAYLSALTAKPNFPDARHNLIVLTHEHGVAAEAEHHLSAFAAQWPNDARLPGLIELVRGARGERTGDAGGGPADTPRDAAAR